MWFSCFVCVFPISGRKIRSTLVNQLSGAAGLITEEGISRYGGKEAT